jgi:hypothetical protein
MGRADIAASWHSGGGDRPSRWVRTARDVGRIRPISSIFVATRATIIAPIDADVTVSALAGLPHVFPHGSRDDADDWVLSAGDVARIFGVRTSAVAQWADEGVLPCRRTTGGHRRFRLSDLERLRTSLTERARGEEQPG